MASNRWLILAVLFVVRTVMGFQFQSVASVAPFLMDDLAIDYAGLGTLVGLYMLPGLVIALPGGVLGQRFGDLRMVLAGLALMVLGGVLMGFADGYGLAVAGRLISGIGAVLLNVLMAKMIADWFVGREIITAMAVLVNSWPLGIALALVSQGPLAAATSWSAVMFAAAAACAVSLVLMALSYRHPRGAPEAAPGALRFDFQGRELALVLIAGAIWAFYNVGYVAVLSFGPDLLIARGYTVADAGGLTSLATWFALITVPIGGYLAERLGRPTATMALCLLGTATLLALLPYWDQPFALLAGIGLLFGPPAGIITAMPAQVVRPVTRGAGMGIFFTCYYLAMAVIPPVVGWTRDATGDAAAPLWFAAAMMFVCLPLLAAFRALQMRAQAAVAA